MSLLCAKNHFYLLGRAEEYLAGSLPDALDQVTKSDPSLKVSDKIIS